MKLQELIKHWQETAAIQLAAHDYTVRLPVYDAARIAALAALYPGRTEQQIITELLSSALEELGQAMPYQQGTKVIGEDECGDPIYEDVGLTPRFLALTQHYLKQFESEQNSK